MLDKVVALVAAAMVAAAPVPAFAGATDFILINGTDSAMGPISIRRFRTGAWQSPVVLPGLGGRTSVHFKDEDCAFDIRANLAAEDTAIWSGVNLCEVEAVILHRDDSGETWVDYD